MEDLVVSSAVVIPAHDLTMLVARSSGPGGQNVNKVNSKVLLRFDLLGTQALSPELKERLRARAKRRVDGEGMLSIVSQVTRDQKRNLEDARERLAELIREAMVVPIVRRATKPTRSSKRRRVEDKRHRSTVKKGRGQVASADQ